MLWVMAALVVGAGGLFLFAWSRLGVPAVVDPWTPNGADIELHGGPARTTPTTRVPTYIAPTDEVVPYGFREKHLERQARELSARQRRGREISL